MDLILNITGSNQFNEITSSQYKGKNFNSEPKQNAFSFNFTKNSKVKAIVARKKNNSDSKIIKNNNNGETFNFVNKPENQNQIAVKVAPISKIVVKISPKKIEKPIQLEPIKKLSSPKSEKPRGFDIFNPDRQKRIDDLRKNIYSEPRPTNPEESQHQQKSSNKFNSPKPFKNKKKGSIFGKDEIPVIGQRFVKPIYEKVFSGKAIASIGLHSHSVKNVKDLLEITELTSVQQKSIPKILEGRDVLVRAQTGSGKTLAYALPIVEKLQEIRPKITRNCGIQALVIVPTRELAIQSYELLLKLLKPYQWIVPGYLSGGEKRKSEKARLRKGINILVGTPGRLVDHLINTESLSLKTVKWLVLDEADRLFELGYEKDVSKIVNVLKNQPIFPNQPKPIEIIKKKKIKKFEDEDVNEDKKELQNNSTENNEEEIKIEHIPIQSILLSATLTSAVEKLAGLTLKNPIFIDNAEEDSTDFKGKTIEETVSSLAIASDLVIPSTVTLNYMIVPCKLRLVTLSALIAKNCNKKQCKILVFVSTQNLVDFHHDILTETLTKNILDDEDDYDENEENSDNEAGKIEALVNVRFFKLHGSLTQIERSAVFKAFCSAKSGVLFTTDVAARGLDVPMVDFVIQYNPPQILADFVHRVGRTARAGRAGRAVIFLSPNEVEYVRILEDKRIRISQVDVEPAFNALIRDGESIHVKEAIHNLQRNFENLITSDKEMYEKACQAYISWVRYYSAFPRDVKNIFNVKATHVGHMAKSFGLKDPPNSIMKSHKIQKPELPNNRLTYIDRGEQKKGKKRPHDDKIVQKHPMKKMNKQTICLTTSEFDSGVTFGKKNKK